MDISLAELVVGIAASEMGWFLQVPFFNATQLFESRNLRR
jgi:hypothetical protein